MNQRGQFQRPRQKPPNQSQQASQYTQIQQPQDTSPISQPEHLASQQAPLQPQVDNIPALNQVIPLPKTRTRRVFKITLYLTGILLSLICAVLVGYYISNNSLGGWLGFFIWLGGATGSTFIFFRRGYYTTYLRWRLYLLLILGATIGSFIALGVLFAILPYPNPNPFYSQLINVIGCSIFLIGSRSLIVIAYLKPSLRQQISESVRGILKATPERQIATPALVAYLQQEYTCPEETFIQYIGKMNDIEQIDIPGTAMKAYHMKQRQKKVLPIPQVPKIVSHQSKHTQTQPPLPTHSVAINPAVPKEVLPTPQVQNGVPPLQAPMIASQQPEQIQAQQPLLNDSVATTPSISKEILPSPLMQNTTPPHILQPSVSQPATPADEEKKAVTIFFCYAHEDEPLLKRLKAQLQPLQRQGVIKTWHDRDISAGAEWEHEINEQLNTAEVILLLVSPDFLASDYCYSKEMQRAIERHERGEACAIPIILRPCDWSVTPLGKLQALPKDGKPVTTWSNRDNAFLDAAQGIRKAVKELVIKLASSPTTSSQQIPNPAKPLGQQYKAGDKVRHPIFGDGVILKSEMQQGTQYVEVQFQGTHGRKMLSLQFAKLEKI